jgi:hypothetical protein
MMSYNESSVSKFGFGTMNNALPESWTEHSGQSSRALSKAKGIEESQQAWVSLLSILENAIFARSWLLACAREESALVGGGRR